MLNSPDRPKLSQMAATLGLSLSTVNRLVRKIKDGEFIHDKKVVFRPTVKGRRRISNKQTSEIVKEVLTSDRTMTLERARRVLERRGIKMSRSTIWRIAKNEMDLSNQKISTRPEAVLGPEIADQRFDYAQQVNELPDKELWFIDESGFNLHIAPLRCWARRGRTPVQRVPTNRGVNVSLLMCISSDGIIFHMVKRGAFKATDFVEFLRSLYNHFEAVRDGEVCLVMDNARIHHARVTQDFLRENDIHHIYLPPYSPDLNPIENVFGVLKARYRSRGVAHSRGQIKRRINIVIDHMNEDLDVQTFYNHMRHFVEMALNRQFIN